MSGNAELDSASQVLDLVIARFEQERYSESNELLLKSFVLDTANSFIVFCLARNCLYMGLLDEAETYFLKSAMQQPTFRWVHYEYARLLLQQKRTSEAAKQMVAFCETYSEDNAPRVWNEVHTDTALKVAHNCFDEDRTVAGSLYSWLYRLGIRDYLCELRIVEQLLDKRMYEKASLQMQELQSQFSLDAWGLFALAKVYNNTNRTSEVEDVVLAAIDSNRSNKMIKVFAAHRFLEFGMLDVAHQFYTDVLVPEGNQDIMIEAELGQVRFRLAVLRHDHQGLAPFVSNAASLSLLPNWCIVEALFTFALPGEQITKLDLAVCIALSDFLEVQKPYTLGTVLSLYQFYSRRRMWDAIAQLDARIQNSALNQDSEVVMRRFEALCAQSRIEDAKELYQSYYAPKELTQWEACVVLRFLAEIKEWEKAACLLFDFIKKGFYFPDGDFFLLKICRQTDCHAKIIEAIDRLENPLPKELSTLRNAATDDLSIRGNAAFAVSDRNRLLSRRRAPLHKKKNVGYFCCDKAYFLSVLTLIVSVVANATDEDELLDWYVFLARDVPSSWHHILIRFASTLNISLTVIAEDAIVSGGAIHLESYGIFTGGNVLSRAAFLRIYAAKYLYELRVYDRALYVDSDIVALSSISQLFTMPFGDSLLMVRAEEPSPEVQDVAAGHGLSEKEYFNSGVLLFRLNEERVHSLLTEAIYFAEKEPRRLMFHDQCALNIAFKGHTSLLSPEWNHFLRPHRPDNGDYFSARLLHFLDKPKPWDVTYHRSYRRIWLRQLAVVRAILDADDFNDLVIAANS